MTQWKNRRPGGKPDPWALAIWLLILAVLLLVLTGEAMDPVPAAPTARERAAQFAAQERYYEALDLYGDPEGATQAAKLIYKNFKEEH